MVECEIEEIKKALINNYFAFIPGHTFHKWLLHFGATEEELALLEVGDVHARVALDPFKELYFRQVGFQRMLYTDVENEERTRNKFGKRPKRIITDSGAPPYQRFSDSEIAKKNEEENAGVADIYDGVHSWSLLPNDYMQSSTPYAFSRILEMFFPEKFTGLEETNSDSKHTLNDHQLIRINKKTDSVECPTPEGIHQDGVQITSITLAGLHNVEKGGESRLWPLSTPPGNYTDEMFESKSSAFSKEKCLFQRALRDKWDTVIFNDRMVKHEATSFDGPRPAYRDIVINAIRKPYTDGLDKMLDENGQLIPML